MSKKQIVVDRIISAVSVHADLSEKESNDLAFHMTDWIDDFDDLHRLFENIENYDDENIYRVLLKFLIHAPEHIAGAAKILTGFGVEDIFRK